MPKTKMAPLAERAPQVLEELGHATAGEMLAHLGIKAGDKAGRNQVFRILWDLVEQGRAVVMPEHLAAGFFWVQPKPRRHDLQAKTRRAIIIRQVKYGDFTGSDLRVMTLAKDGDYTKRLLHFWEGLGLLLPTGETRGGEPVYQLAPDIVAELPHYHRRAEERKEAQEAARQEEVRIEKCRLTAQLAQVGFKVQWVQDILQEMGKEILGLLGVGDGPNSQD